MLESVRSIDICQDKTTGNCLGILLHYEDCTREVLGQWRFDHVIKAMANQDIPHLIHFHLDYVESIPCVKNICFNSQVDGPGWITVAMQGCLVWWFSALGGIVVHEKNT
jgi:hypothetical protein